MHKERIHAESIKEGRNNERTTYIHKEIIHTERNNELPKYRNTEMTNGRIKYINT